MRHGAPEELIADSIRLRKTVAADAEAIFEAIFETNDTLYPRMRWATAIPSLTKTVEHCESCERDWESGTTLNFTIFSRDGAVLGRCSLHHIDWGVPKFEVGYWIRKSAQGQGIATTATQLMTEMAFTVLGARRVSLWCAVDNVPSRRVAQKLGFTHEGTFKNDEVDALGRPIDMDIFAITNFNDLKMN